MKNKKLIIIAIITIVVIIAIICAVSTRGRSSDSSSLSSEEETTSNDKTESQSGTSQSENTSNENNPQTQDKDTKDNNTMPYSIPGTNLVINRMDSYEGIFLEDGSDQSVSNVTAIVVENTGNIGLEYADITINLENTQLHFKATAIPAGKTIVVQESNKTEYINSDIVNCSAEVAELKVFEMSESLVKVEETEDGSLKVTNLTDETLPVVRIFYKFALEKGEIYVGGITYTAKLTDLAPNGSQNVTPAHYVAGSSEIMMVRVYETE